VVSVFWCWFQLAQGPLADTKYEVNVNSNEDTIDRTLASQNRSPGHFMLVICERETSIC
jgi:hypothetical protein